MRRLLVYAGPNGSGKSSLRDRSLAADAVEVVIDPDRIARGIAPSDPRSADRAAGRAALLLFEAGLAAGRSMSLETTLSGRSVLRRLRDAKRAGYEVELRFVALDLVGLNIQRIEARAALGGHHIAPEVVRRRHVGSLANLADALAIVDRAVLTDNSGQVPRPVMEVEAGRIVRAVPDLPDWLRAVADLLTDGRTDA